jgi:hypothetical protein
MDLARGVQTNNQRHAIKREFEPVGLTLLKNPLNARWGLLLTLRRMGSWLPTYLPTYLVDSPPSSRDKNSQRGSNRQPLHSDLGTSPLSPNSLGSSRTS